MIHISRVTKIYKVVDRLWLWGSWIINAIVFVRVLLNTNKNIYASNFSSQDKQTTFQINDSPKTKTLAMIKLLKPLKVSIYYVMCSSRSHPTPKEVYSWQHANDQQVLFILFYISDIEARINTLNYLSYKSVATTTNLWSDEC